MEEIDSLIVPSPTPVILVHIEEVPIPRESIPVPPVHTEIAGNTEDIQVVEHPPIVQEGFDVNAINNPADVQLQREESSGAHSLMQEGD